MQKEEITRAILRYMLDHPQACDTVDGIIQWWVIQGSIDLNLESGREVIHQLIAQHLLIEKTGTDSSKVYCINNAKMKEIGSLI